MSEPLKPGSSGLIAVLGAGIAGLAAAAQLSAAGHRVIVIDQSHRAGGTHRSRQIGPYTFDVGSVFYEETASIFDLAPSLREICPEVASVQRRIAPDGSILLYPIAPRDLLRQKPARLAFSALDLLFSRLTLKPDGSLETLCRKRLGTRFFTDTGLRHYITRFHHVQPHAIDEEFFFRRMAIIDRFTRLENLARSAMRVFVPEKGSAARHWPMRVRPRQGFDVLFSAIVQHLTAQGVTFALGERLEALEKDEAFFRIRTESCTRLATSVVSTIPLDALHRALFSEPSGLESLDMTTLHVSAEWLHPDSGNVLFNFHPDGAWKRATVYSRIYPNSANERASFSVETTLAPGSAHEPQPTFEAFRTHALQLGLARGLRLEGHDLVKSCYPLYTVGYRKKVNAVLDRIKRTGIVTAGRQGRFEYLPTSTGVIAQVSHHVGVTAMASAAPGIAA